MIEALLVGVVATALGVGCGLALTGWVVHGVVPDTFPDLGMIVSLSAGSLAAATVLGTAAVALAPLFTTRRHATHGRAVHAARGRMRARCRRSGILRGAPAAHLDKPGSRRGGRGVDRYPHRGAARPTWDELGAGVLGSHFLRCRQDLGLRRLPHMRRDSRLRVTTDPTPGGARMPDAAADRSLTS